MKRWIALGLIALWIANRAIGPGNALDSGLYHYQVMRWNHEHPIEAGLANLHPLFAYNNSFHLFDALLQAGPWEGRANHLANGLLLLIWLGTVVISGARLLRVSDENRAQDLFNLVLMVPLVMYAVSKEASSPTSDLPQAALAFAAASTFVRVLNTEPGDDAGERAFATVSVVLLAAAALCVKLSAGALAVSLGFIALVTYLMQKSVAPWRRVTVGWSCGLAFALAASWMARGVVLSGFPLYPSRLLAAPVEWRAPPIAAGGLGAKFRSQSEQLRVGMLRRAVASADFQRLPQWIARPIRNASENSSGAFAWMLAMLLASTIEIALPAGLALLAIFALIIQRIRKDSTEAARGVEWLATLPPLMAIIVWAIAAPEPRFAAASFWILAAALVAKVCRTSKRPFRIIGAMLVLSALAIGYRMIAAKLNPAADPVRNVLFIAAGPDHGFHPTPTVQMHPFEASNGLIIFVPPPTDPCWDAPLPSTSAPHPLLRLRVPDDLESGFVLEVGSES